MLGVLKYIFKQNLGLNIIKYLFVGAIFQLFKRLTNSIISKKIFNGKSIFMYPNCNVSSMYAYTSIPDKQEINILRNIVKNGKAHDFVFLDIGSNIGSYSVSMMDICADIIAFEPHPYTSKRCKMNFLLNNISENNVKQLALSDSIGKIHFSDYGGSSTINHIVNDNSGIEVEVTTLDKFIEENNFLIENKYIIKIDVEGFEEQVLRGGANFLSNYNIKGIVFECFSQDKVFEILKEYGYEDIKKLSENNYFATKTTVGR